MYEYDDNLVERLAKQRQAVDEIAWKRTRTNLRLLVAFSLFLIIAGVFLK